MIHVFTNRFCLAVLIIGGSLLAVPHQTRAQAALSSISATGVTLHSLSLDLPNSDRQFAGDAKADAINSNCLACHSAGMVLNQPKMSAATWTEEVNKMRAVFKAPIADEDVPVIVDYLVKLQAQK